MATLFDTQSLQPVEVPDADAPNAVLSGRYGIEAGREVALYKPDGTMVAVPAESAPLAFEQGYTFAPQTEIRAKELEDKYGTLGAKALAGGAGALRGLTLGLSDRALRNSGVTAAELRDLEEGAPITSGVTEAAGMIAPLLLSGGSSAGAQAAGAIPRGVATIGGAAGKKAVGALGLEGATSLLGRAGAKAVELGVAGAVEGGIYGAGNLVSEDALGRADLNAESLAAHVGMGALLGGGAGALLGIGGTVAGAALRKAADKASDALGGDIGAKLRELADESALKATGARGADIRKLGTDEKIAQIGNDLRSYTLKSGEKVLKFGDNADDLLPRIKQAKGEVTKDLGEFRKQIDDFVRANPDDAWDVGEYLSRVRQEVLDPLRESGVPSVRAKAKKVMRELMPLQRAWEDGRKLAPKTLTKLRQDLADIVYPKRPPGGGLPPQPPAHAAELMQAERILESFIEENTERVAQKMGGEDLAGRYAELRRLSESFIKAEKLADKASKQNLGNRSFSLTDYLAGIGGAAAGGVGGLALAAGASIGNKVLRERARSAIAVAAEKAAGLQAIKKASDAAQKRIDKALGGFLYRQPGNLAAAIVPVSSNILFEHSFLPGGAKAEAPKDPKDAAKARAKELASLVSDPQKLADKVAMSIGDVESVAPNTASQLAATTARTVEFLHAKAPKQAKLGNSLQPLLDDWMPDDKQVRTFSRYMRAALDPISVLEDLGSGLVTKEGVETLRELYPRLHELSLGKLAEALASKREKLAYQDRINLSLVFGVPADDTMRPDFVARAQQMWAERQQAQAQSGLQGAGSTGSLGLGESMRTRAQMLEVKQ